MTSRGELGCQNRINGTQHPVTEVTMHRQLAHLCALTAIAAALTACDRSPTEAPIAPQANATLHGPVIIPISLSIDAPDGCTGEPATYTITGTMLVQEKGDMVLIVTHGKVEVSTGFAGVFSRTELVRADRVAHLRYHDVEVSNTTGQVFVWSVGLNHYTTADGELKVAMEQYGGIGCRGR